MTAAAIASLSAGFLGYEGFAQKMIFTMIVTTIVWVPATYLTRPDDEDTLQSFYDRVKPGGPGWDRFRRPGDRPESLWGGIGMVVLSALSIILFLYAMGQLFFGSMGIALGCTVVSIGVLWWVVKRI
jgi:solute:Na+ symporter, SSS family